MRDEQAQLADGQLGFFLNPTGVFARDDFDPASAAYSSILSAATSCMKLSSITIINTAIPPAT